MKPLRSPLVLFALAAHPFAAELAASCAMGELPRVATLEVERCRDAESVLRERAEAGEVRLQPGGRTVLARIPGVVLDGRVTRKVHVEQHAANDVHVVDVVPADETGRWFVPVPADGAEGTPACDRYAEGAAVELFIADPCCDTFPPSEPACLLDVGSGEPVAPELAEAVAAFLRDHVQPE